ncbi:hypothetical protein PR048_011680 [Dryococelus australis]|uniref:Uncharacterized protein n=1 Tax=Dryococelus australis TaxID=614101 RepID=A0ABQ9HMB3_9NEOP|nr:hypothetical protein PR048_011680 [Dryococelus australis]
MPIVETILLCARQEMPFQGTNDSGTTDDGGTEPDWNYGNFRELLKMCAKCGDVTLKRHVISSPSNALSQYFLVLTDETCDILRTMLMSLCLCGVDKFFDDSIYILREDLFDFVPVYDLTGLGLATVITN